MRKPTTPILHKNVDLARNLAQQFATDVPGPQMENEHIIDLLTAGDDDEIIFFRGDCLSTVIDTLNKVVILASVPVPIRRTKSSEKRRMQVARERQDILLVARVALALLDTTPTPKSGMPCATPMAEQKGCISGY